MAHLVAGALNCGGFEERVMNFVYDIGKSQGSVIVFFGDLHTLINAISSSNILEPAVARADFKV